MKPSAFRSLFAGLCAAFLAPGAASASTAYGSINNFDVVNDTGTPCHGFEIEIEDCPSTGITYTYDWNHYGTCRITQDDSLPGHPKSLIRWAAVRKPDGTWSAHTAVPTTSIAPTNGHMFTNPAVNFGGEHFGEHLESFLAFRQRLPPLGQEPGFAARVVEQAAADEARAVALDGGLLLELGVRGFAGGRHLAHGAAGGGH